MKNIKPFVFKNFPSFDPSETNTQAKEINAKEKRKRCKKKKREK